jgi:uncharacterized protein YjhX (UPF0386 family)
MEIINDERQPEVSLQMEVLNMKLLHLLETSYDIIVQQDKENKVITVELYARNRHTADHRVS